MTRKTIAFVVGTRPNFVKAAPVIEALEADERIGQLVVHTGQHYDAALSDEILQDLGFPVPHRFLGVGSGTHAEQTGKTLIEVERVLQAERPDLVVVSGDVNATLAAALAAAKLSIPLAHIESGLRSRDWTMPEEINRVLTDRLCEILFTHSPEAADNLAVEGVDPARVHYVGNTMIDSLRRFEDAARAAETWTRLGVEPAHYVLVTLHRPSNVDDPARLSAIVEALAELASSVAVVFPIHPRTRERLDVEGSIARLASTGVRCLDPLGYLDFLSLELAAGAVLTDSGGIQEETSALGVACYTLRANTERPITLTAGTNTLLGDDPLAIASIRLSPPAPPPPINLWDGHAGERAAAILAAAVAGERGSEHLTVAM
jgi:UDP-N-acetylglucosamine 2-epimerase (non-hydrolysing)